MSLTKYTFIKKKLASAVDRASGLAFGCPLVKFPGHSFTSCHLLAEGCAMSTG